MKIIISLVVLVSVSPCTADVVNNSISCRPGAAIAELTWLDEGYQKLKTHIECVNVSSSCEEVRTDLNRFRYELVIAIDTFVDM